MSAAVVWLPPVHTVTIYTGYYINWTHPVIFQADNNTVETCLKPAEWEGNLPDCLFCMCGFWPNGFVLALHNGPRVTVQFGGSGSNKSHKQKRRGVANYNKPFTDWLKKQRKIPIAARRMYLPGSTLNRI